MSQETNRILYCECGEFIPCDVQDLQHDKPKCIKCAVKAAQAALKLIDGGGR